MKKNEVSGEKVALDRYKKRPIVPYPAMPDSFCNLDSYCVFDKTLQRYGFQREVEEKFDKICKKAHIRGLASLTAEERKFYEEISECCRRMDKFSLDLTKDCMPYRKKGIKGLFHDAIRATPYGILIPWEISSSKDLPYYFGQVTALRKRYLPDFKNARPGPMKKKPLAKDKVLWFDVRKAVIAGVYGEKIARKHIAHIRNDWRKIWFDLRNTCDQIDNNKGVVRIKNVLVVVAKRFKIKIHTVRKIIYMKSNHIPTPLPLIRST